MAREINTINQANLWGKQASDGQGLDPQRADLYMVDFTPVIKQISSITQIILNPVLPQYIRSIALPEIRTKPDIYRQDSVPFNLPSWDDPLDAIRITFLIDTHNEDDSSAVLRFLEVWLALTRAGRGSRQNGYTLNTNWFTLNSDYRADFQFNVNIYLLRGALITAGGFVTDGRDDTAFRRFTALANAAYRNIKKQSGNLQLGNPVPNPEQDNSFETAVTYAALHENDAINQDMVAHTILVLKNAWLSAYKISDLSYTDNGLATIDATFYADSIDHQNMLRYNGQLLKLDN